MRKGWVSVSIATVHRGPYLDSEVVTSAKLGETFRILEVTSSPLASSATPVRWSSEGLEDARLSGSPANEASAWWKIELDYDGYQGYLPCAWGQESATAQEWVFAPDPGITQRSDWAVGQSRDQGASQGQLQDDNHDRTSLAVVRNLFAQVYSGPAIQQPLLVTLPLGVRVWIVDEVPSKRPGQEPWWQVELPMPEQGSGERPSSAGGDAIAATDRLATHRDGGTAARGRHQTAIGEDETAAGGGKRSTGNTATATNRTFRRGFMQKGDLNPGGRAAEWAWHTLPELRAGLVATALRFLGVPYRWGGTSSFGIDCSGFVQLLYRLHGLYLPRDANQQAKYERMKPISRDELVPGDLLFFNDYGHVGMAISHHEFIHASTHDQPLVQISRVDEPHWTQVRCDVRRYNVPQ